MVKIFEELEMRVGNWMESGLCKRSWQLVIFHKSRKSKGCFFKKQYFFMIFLLKKRHTMHP